MGGVADDLVDGLLSGKPPSGGQGVADSVVDGLLNKPPPQEQGNGFVRWFKDSVKGNAEFDYPEPPLSVRGAIIPDGKGGMKGVLGPLMDTEFDQEGKFNLFKQSFPSAEKKLDANGNLYVRMADGRQFYLNRPGFSENDIDEGMTALGFSIPFLSAGGRLGAAVGGGTGRVAGVGVAEAAGNALQQGASMEAGGREEFDVWETAVAGLFGIGGEVMGIGAGAIIPFVKKIFAGNGYDPITQTLSREATRLLESFGLDLDKVTPDVARRLHRMAKDNVDVPDAEKGVVADALTLPEPVDLSRGDITRDASQQMFEDQAKKGSLGEGAEKELQAFREGQQEALGKNVDIIQENLSGGRAQVNAPGEGAGAVQEALVTVEKQMKAAEDEAFRIARSSDASLSRGYAHDGVKGKLLNTLDEMDFDVDAMPRVQALLKFFDKKAGIKMGKEGIEDLDGAVNISDLEKWRRNAVKAKGSTPEEDSAISHLIRAYDEAVGNLVNKSILEGDEKVIKNWADARLEATRLREIFKAGDLVEALVDTEKGVLKVGVDDAVKLIFGRGKLGGKSGMAKEVTKLKKILLDGGKEAEWNALREEAFLRILAPQRKGNNRGKNMERLFSGDKFATALDEAMESAPTAMREIFTEAELSVMEQLKRVALRVTNSIEGGKNLSNSASAISIITQRINATLGPIGPVVSKVLSHTIERFEKAGATLRAKDAVSATTIRPKPPPKRRGLGGAAAAPFQGLAKDRE